MTGPGFLKPYINTEVIPVEGRRTVAPTGSTPCPIGMSKNNSAMKGKHEIDAGESVEVKEPTLMQKEFAHWLDGMGRWDLFWTFTFKPNDYEEIVQRKNGDFTWNKRTSWCGEGERILKRVHPVTGLQKFGAPSVSPGWSMHAAGRSVKSFLKWSMRDARWFMVVESSKFRSCAHAHVLSANNPTVNVPTILRRWQKKYGRADCEVIKKDLGVAHYLCKGYVAKNYGKQDDLSFEFSKNCVNPKSDDIDPGIYHMKDYLKRRWRANKEDYSMAANQLKLVSLGLLKNRTLRSTRVQEDQLSLPPLAKGQESDFHDTLKPKAEPREEQHVA